MIKIHPLCFLVGILLFFNGYIAVFAIYFISLLWHELGHLLAIILCKGKLLSCTIYPYGGEIEVLNWSGLNSYKKLLIVAAGPLFTLFALLFCLYYEPPFVESFKHINIFLLAINLLPFWPLDGGRIIYIVITAIKKGTLIYNAFINYSLISLVAISLVLIYKLPESSFLLFNFIMLLSQVFGEWRFRKYRITFEKTISRQLT